jgi:two-component system, chemotaxis family, protein-glutamate methylesterase/glutaminase
MLVDDSAVIRGLFTRALEADPEIQVIASVGDGQMAVNALKRTEVDVIVLDIEMPNMDGLTALPLLIAAAPTVHIIMASTLTRQNAEISLRALRAGAKDYVSKPSTTSELTSADSFKRELISKIKALGGSTRSPRKAMPHYRAAEPAARPRDPTDVGHHAPPIPSAVLPTRGAPVVLRAAMTETPDVIAIGSSTGGPQALFTVLGGLKRELRQPILVTQHMPPTFTTILAEHVGRVAERPTFEGRDGLAVEPGHIYIAPGDFHMVVEARGAQRIIRLLKTPPENYCRPSVDPMLRSLIAIYGKRILVAILTGMGHDGLSGCDAVVKAGGGVIAQDEASSVVWGMPGAVATKGLCSAVLPISDIAGYIQRFALRHSL